MPPAYHCSTLDPRWRSDLSAISPSIPREIPFSLEVELPPRASHDGPCAVPDCAVCSGEMARAAE